jgi:NAD(P)-dependent dehydrogenase (short-subunit alcohol dehydrogenase family)
LNPREAMSGCLAVVITGGGTGIGRATAQMFASEENDVLIVGRSQDSLNETAKGWPTIRTLVADISDREAPQAIVSTAEREFGRIDILVNNAAVKFASELDSIDRDEAEEQLATNLIAPIFLTQEAVKHMHRGGIVINVTTNVPGRGWPGNSIYGSTKVSLDFLTRTWAVELAQRGIRVVSISPGPTNTPMLHRSRMALTPELAEAKNKRIPLGRVAEPDEIAWWIMAVTRPYSSYVTGAVISVDGGASLV